jgi:hypothetical protein
VKTILLLLISISCFSQKLHHQMISSLGTNMRTTNGVSVRQTVGQQSVIGNFAGSNVYVGQGFLQSGKMSPIEIPGIRIITTTYPNPFIDKVNFKFSSFVEGSVNIKLFDLLGRLVYNTDKYPINNTVTIDNLIFFANGEYIAKLTAKNFTYSTNLLKTK